MFTTDVPFLLFDYFRVPYEHARRETAGLATVRADTTGRRLLYPHAVPIVPAPFMLGSMRLFGGVVPVHEMRALLPDGWEPAEGHEPAVWRNADGDVALAFDPNEVILAFWSERYHGPRRIESVQSALRRTYYLVRPVLPRRVQIAVRRGIRRLQARSKFPAWPVESSLHDFYDWLFALLHTVSDAPIPAIDFWPAGHSWAFVLTHDVETGVGLANIHLLREIERPRGFRSSWNFVPHRYEVRPSLVARLDADGCEVGVHGLEHDGRDVRPLSSFVERLPEIRRYAELWNAVGFRSPATHRDWASMPLLDFDYDSSSPDTDPFEPQSGGCCSWLPFFNESLVELPITLTQDHTLFTILQRPDESEWLAKARYLRDRGGMALLITHPDYMLTRAARSAYARLLDAFAEDDTVWRALPREVSAWWRRRAASSIRTEGQGWVVDGPAAADARVVER